MKLFNEKRSDLEEQQLHLNVGLQKIRETVDQVNSLSLWRCFSATSALHETLSAILKQLPYFEELFEGLLKVQLVDNSSELVFVLEITFFPLRDIALHYVTLGGRAAKEFVTQEPGIGGKECFSQSEAETDGK